ncbi:AraC family transcriptional regulator [Paraburkholderia sp. CNPSo 3274]|uniref:AraC family transcriptional regulator n=1 Tax=Paraburkholderia sp. CNPSo 3274 TaxID=2940932 RepID=UPI0020B873F0|nr:AraC family transcriptional regulator [Paraburkholderia sp. CNPSo 3274]MCP3712954.1 AraC family transcriptional regulator [Paraburkholderia sp. CNPSo 3274]
METMLRSVSMSGYFDVALRVGLNTVELAHEAGLDAAALANPDERIPAAAACLLLERSAQKASCPTFALQMAATRRKFGTGVVNVLLVHKRTLREVLLAGAEYGHLLNEALAVHIEDTGTTVTIREELVVDTGIPTNQAIELAVGVLARHSTALLGEHWKPRAVHFIHQAPPSLAFHRRFFGCPLEFGSDFNGLVCATADLDHTNPAADPELARYAKDLAESLNVTGAGSIVLEVRKALYLLLPLGQATVEQVAARLHRSVRTMQRQLELANTSFSRLTEGVRYELAVRFMSNSRYPIGRVSGLVGYAHQGPFTNWFVGRFGMTPRAWRNNHRRWLC